MFILSTNAKEAIKIGLAITIAYYIALSDSWMSPTWAAISVAMISLPTAGQSLHKGVLRMGGTLLAFVVGLFYLGLFPQDRWLFLLSFSPYLAFVTYKMTGKNGQYFWFVAAFVSMMITTAGPGSSEHAFEFAAFRTIETMIGIVIWTLISVFIWPRSNRTVLKKVSQSLIAHQQEFVHNYQACVIGSKSGEKLIFDQSQSGKLLSQFQQTMASAASENYEVHEVRFLWDRLGQLSLSMMESMNRLQLGYADLQGIDLEKILPQMPKLFSGLESRFRHIQNVLDNKSAPYTGSAVFLIFSDKGFSELDHFQRAAIQVTKNELHKLDTLTDALVTCTRQLAGYEEVGKKTSYLVSSEPTQETLGLPVLDPDRVRASIMVVVSMWVGALIWIYWNPPGHISWYQFVPNVALIAAQNPQFKLNILQPFAFAYLAALVVYVFIMPQLSMFWELGLVIFVFTFVAAYLFSGIGRMALYLSMFNMLAVQNQQSYDFSAQCNAFLFTMLALVVVVSLTHIVCSPRQEKEFLSMMSRYFRSCEFLVSRIADTAKPVSVSERLKRAYYRQELETLPAKLSAWGAQIDHNKFPNTSTQQMNDMVATLQTLSYSITALEESCATPQSNILTQALRDDLQEWRIVFEVGFERWAVRPETKSVDELRTRLSARLSKLNTRIEVTLNNIADGATSTEERRDFYQQLGSFRGVTQAAIAYADTAGAIDWAQWREERF